MVLCSKRAGDWAHWRVLLSPWNLLGLLKYTRTPPGKVTFSSSLAWRAKAFPAAFPRKQVCFYHFYWKDSTLIFMKCILTLSLWEISLQTTDKVAQQVTFSDLHGLLKNNQKVSQRFCSLGAHSCEPGESQLPVTSKSSQELDTFNRGLFEVFLWV